MASVANPADVDNSAHYSEARQYITSTGARGGCETRCKPTSPRAGLRSSRNNENPDHIDVTRAVPCRDTEAHLRSYAHLQSKPPVKTCPTSPASPCLGPLAHLCLACLRSQSIPVSDHSTQSDVGRWQAVAYPQPAHEYVFRCPASYPTKACEACNCFLMWQCRDLTKVERPFADRLR